MTVSQRSALAPWFVGLGAVLALASLLLPWMQFHEEAFWDVWHEQTGIVGVGEPTIPADMSAADQSAMRGSIDRARDAAMGGLHGYDQRLWVVLAIVGSAVLALWAWTRLREGREVRGELFVLATLGTAGPAALCLLTDPNDAFVPGHAMYSLTAAPGLALVGGLLIALGALGSGAWGVARGTQASAAPSLR